MNPVPVAGEAGLRVVHLNPWSIVNKFHDVRSFITESSFGIVAISETWLGSEVRSGHYQICGYTLYRKDRSGRGGGVAFYVSDSLGSHLLPTEDPGNGIDQLWIRFKINKLSFTVGVVYKPPNVAYHELRCLYDIFADVIQSSDVCLCLGDFNVDFSSRNLPSYKFLSDLLASFGFIQLINTPTRVSRESESVLDLIITNRADLVKVSGVVPCDPIVSDHLAVYCALDCAVPRNSDVCFEYRDFNNIDVESFKRCLLDADWHELYRAGDVDVKVDLFNSFLIDVFDFFCPVKKVTRVNRKPPWLTYNLKKMINLRNKAFRKYLRDKTTANKCYYLELKKIVSDAIKSEKKACFTFHIGERNGPDKTRQFWKKVRAEKIFHQSRISIPDNLCDANVINTHLLTNVPEMNVDREYINSWLSNNLKGNVLQFRLVDEVDILPYLCGLNGNSVGADDISPKMLKLCLPYILQPIVNIVNFSLETGQFPSLWKMSLVTPLPKKEDPTLNDLRPISILPTLSKVLERIVRVQLTEFIEQNNLLPDYQSGFRAGFSCTTALLKITDDINRAFDGGGICPSVLLDMTKAFDSLNIDLLISKLRFYNLDCNGWFTSYLNHRQQAVRLRKPSGVEISEFRAVESGVPQGSILGPVLFILFTSDLTKVIKQCCYHMYADDLQIYGAGQANEMQQTVNKINLDLENILNWANQNSLCINPSKTQAILFSRTDLGTCRRCDIVLGGIRIEWKDEVKNLGLIMDNRLTFNSHVNKVCQTSFLRLKIIYEYKKYLPVFAKKMLTSSIVLSVPSYLDCVYGPYLTEFNKYRIQKIQNNCVRYIMCLTRRDHISHHVVDIFQLNMSQRRFLHISSIIHNIVQTETPGYLFKCIKFRGDLHHINIRHKDTLDIPKHKLEIFKCSFSYLVAYVYNLIPVSLKRRFCSTFKTSVRQYIRECNWRL